MITNKRIPLRYPFSLIKWDILFTAIFSVTIHYVTKYIFEINLSISIAAFMGTAIALILSFKLSQSYDRWWEARKIWGAIVNDSRTLVLQLKHFTVNDTDENTLTKRISYRQIAWSYAFGEELRNQSKRNTIEKFISKDEYEVIKDKKNISLALLNKQFSDIKSLYKSNTINNFQQIQIDNTLTRLTASMGMAERIKNTNFPKPYRLTLQFFIYLFLVILAFSLTDYRGFISIPILILIALPFFLLEKIALNMQDPFENKPTDTAMTTIARTIEINIKELLGEDDIPLPLVSKTFYNL